MTLTTIAQTLHNAGFIVRTTSAGVEVSLTNRSVSSMEVATALRDAAGLRYARCGAAVYVSIS